MAKTHHMTIKANERYIASQKSIIAKCERLRAVNPAYMSEETIAGLKETLARMEAKHERLLEVA